MFQEIAITSAQSTNPELQNTHVWDIRTGAMIFTLKNTNSNQKLAMNSSFNPSFVLSNQADKPLIHAYTFQKVLCLSLNSFNLFVLLGTTNN